jgi:hypothetical protein
MTNVIRTFASKPFVVVAREDRSIIGSSGNLAHARALGAAAVGENGYSIVDLSDVAGFEAAAINAGDTKGARVARTALRSKGGKSRRQVAEWILAGAVG